MYKKLLLVFLSAIAIQTVKAQTQKGSQMLGASFGVSTTNSDVKGFNSSNNTYDVLIHEKLRYYSIAPTYSYFIADKLDIGVSAGYAHASQMNNVLDVNGSDVNIKSNTYSGTVYLRKYFLYDNKIGIRTGPYFGYQYSNTTRSSGSDPENKDNNKSYTGGLGLDFIYLPVKRLGLSAMLGSLSYAHQSGSNAASKSSSDSFNLGLANALTLSVNYVFGK